MSDQTHPSDAALQARCFACTDIGRVRDQNEDAFVVGDLDRVELLGGDVLCATGARGALLVVCDGMGGAEGGEVASTLAVNEIWREMVGAQHTASSEVFARLLRRAVRAANRRVFSQAKAQGLRGMGTTVSAAGFADGKVVIAQVGDSRAYLLRVGELVQVTRDQTLVSALAFSGHPTQPGDNPSAILQAVGVGGDVDASLSIVPLRRGDRLLLCTDGIHSQLSDLILREVLLQSATPEMAARGLVNAAAAAGGHDNATAAVAFVDGVSLSVPHSATDLPTFREFDPREEGERALTSTSHVARRLAAQVGIGEHPGFPIVPATGQFSSAAPSRRGLAPLRSAPQTRVPDVPGPARRRLGRFAAPGRIVWLLSAALVAIAAWLLAGLV